MLLVVIFFREPFLKKTDLYGSMCCFVTCRKVRKVSSATETNILAKKVVFVMNMIDKY